MKGKTSPNIKVNRMSNNDWVQAGTPREDEWADEQDEYGVPVSPVEWDDYAAEQSVPVPQPVAAEPEVAEPEAAPERAAVEEAVEDEAPAEPEPEADVEEQARALFEEAPVVEETVEIDEQPAADVEETTALTEETVAFAEADEPAPSSAEEAAVEAEERPLVLEETAAFVPEEPIAEEEPTQAVLAAAAVGAAAPIAGLYRGYGELPPAIDQTQRINLADEAAEEQRIADQLRADKEARDQRLGLVATSDANAVRAAAPLPRPGVGRFASLGLLALRLVTAAILGIIGYQILSNVDASAELLGRTLLPEPRLITWIVGFGLAALAVMLIIGLAVRVVGFLMTVLAVGSLAFLRWGAFSVFRPGIDGFIGDRDLLLAAIGILFFCVGGGRAGVDAAFSLARWRAKEAKRS